MDPNLPHHPKACILVLEEEPMLRAGLRSTLAEAGYAVPECTQSAGRIDLVLAGISGRRNSNAAWQSLDADAPAILLVDHAAWTGFDFFDAANAIGAVAVLQRPFSRATLLRVVADLLSEPRYAVAPAENAGGELPGFRELLFRLENPNFP